MPSAEIKTEEGIERVKLEVTDHQNVKNEVDV